MGGFGFFLFALVSQTTNASSVSTPPVAVATNAITPAPSAPPFSEQVIKTTIDYIGYVENGRLVELGLRRLEQILKKMDLSNRDDLRAALVKVMSLDPATQTASNSVGFFLRNSAGESLGHAKLVDQSSTELIALLKGKETTPSEAALVEYAKTTKKSPGAPLIDALKDLKMYKTLSNIALHSADKAIISYLVQIAQSENNLDLIYGLDGKDAADAVVKSLRLHLEVPEAPSNITGTLTTYHSGLLSWKDNSSNEDGFLIERSVNGDPFKQLIRLPSNQIYYQDDGLKPKTKYEYKIRSFNWNAGMIATNSVVIETPTLPDPLPHPEPVAPPTPASPSPSLLFGDLIRTLRLEVEGEPHNETLQVLIDILKMGTDPVDVAIEIGKLAEFKFERKLFDFDVKAASLGVDMIDAFRWRSGYESTDITLIESLRRDYATKLNLNRMSLEKRFFADLETTQPTPTPISVNPPTTTPPSGTPPRSR
ncbi:MAG: Fibronectin type domain protein [Bacteriovoracaceae bacterium]|nr:Fibronectin type domain protein [Bacteriovoracaceae bacterium]